MQKGIFTQGIAVLLSEPVTIEQAHRALREQFAVGDINDFSKQWAYGGKSFVISFRPEVNGYLMVDIVDRPWPDDMGHPQDDPRLFDAWSLGQFGPFAYPGNLERSVEQAWGSYPEGRQAAADHQAFIRIRTSYILGEQAGDDAPVLPEGYDPMQELVMITAAAARLMEELPAALCYFNPGGECLASGGMLKEAWSQVEAGETLSLDLWSNIRLYRLPQEDWILMDTVGMWQLDVADHEAIFQKDRSNPTHVADFLRNISLYFLKDSIEAGIVVQVEGPGGIAWQGELYDNGILQPPRQTVRWYRQDETGQPVQ
ncbi:MAG: hypothetical protein K0Q90_2912 [Paenibacillaceae bacterium]|jgi:hypothetical protein|nr:hypothetical protein [Paenibacillaceae bacterium]